MPSEPDLRRPRPPGARALRGAVPMAGVAPVRPGRGIDPSVVVEGKPLLTAQGHLRHPGRYERDPRGLAYPAPGQDPSTYYTTNDIAKILVIDPNLVHKWCRKSWFGPLPAGRQGGTRLGYRIPREYLYIARGWLQTEDLFLREKIRLGILKQLRDFVIICGDLVSTHYTSAEVVSRLESLHLNTSLARCMTVVICVGPIRPEDSHLTR